MRKAYADQLGLVSLRNHDVPTEMGVAAGTVVLAMGWETRSGRSPLSRLVECFAQHAPELLLGQAVPPQACNDAPAGRLRERLDAWGTMRLGTAWAVRAATRCGVERRSGPCETPARRGWGDAHCAETPDRPLQGTSGSRPDKRPDLTPCSLSPLCVERAVPLWGKPEAGPAADPSLKTPL